MPFSMEWLVPQRVCFLRVAGEVTRDDLKVMGEMVEGYIEEGIAPVHLVMDTVQMSRFPVSVIQIHGFSRWLYHANTGQIILINPTQIVSFLGLIISSMAHIDLKIATSQAEALQVLYRDDGTLGQPH